MKMPRRMFALAALAGAPFVVQSCEPMVAGTTEPARAACRMLYQDAATGDAYMYNGYCIVPRNPTAPNWVQQDCLAALNAAWGVQTAHPGMCDYPSY